MKRTNIAHPRSFSLALAFALNIAIPAIFSPSLHAEAYPPFTGWKTASTNHFRFIFEDASSAQTEAFSRVADNAWNRISQIYATPPEITDVIVTGRTDTVNAYAQGLSFYISFFTNPPMSPDFGYREDWSALFFTHELVHIANFSFEGKNRTAAKIFGPLVNFFDMIREPTWYREGLATVLETELTQGGRGRSPYFELYYKSLALENSFMDFSEIGSEKQAPQGQAYVMGYLIMRSIADRFGIDALSAIERNRVKGVNFAKSVRMVTGETPEELFNDARISLEKRYAGERAITEGVTVSPRVKDTYYYRPALVNERGIITLRDSGKEGCAAVRYDPATRKETVLFKGNFPDKYSLTASDDGKIIASLQSENLDSMPGYAVSSDLYNWSKEQGLCRLTEGSSLFTPALSKSGNRLVAVELSGTHYRIVEIDLSTGERTILVESVSENYIQPALSSDGTSIAFLAVSNTRAALAVAPMPPSGEKLSIEAASIRRPVNETGAIIDIAFPSWTSDDTILFASNERGRLEVWELKNGETNPVVSDPVGALWAERTDQGIWYASYAGTGNVIKMKPSSEWGKVPDFPGPSSPGSTVTLGELASDFPLFVPFPQKTVQSLRRNGTGRTTEIASGTGAKKNFVNFPTLSFWCPSFNYVQGAFGTGAFALFNGLPLQNAAGLTVCALGGNWYPSIDQVDFEILSMLPFYTGQFFGILERSLNLETGTDNFLESTQGTLSLSVPLRSRYFYHDALDAAVVMGLNAAAQRRDDRAFAAGAELPFQTAITGKAGFDLLFSEEKQSGMIISARERATALVSSFPSLSSQVYPSAEFDGAFSTGNENVLVEAGLRARWFNMPENAALPSTLVNPKGEIADCLYPGRSILRAALIIPKAWTRLYVEKMISSGKNTAGMDTPENGTFLNYSIDPRWYTGAEMELESGRNRAAFGLVCKFGNGPFDASRDLRIYFTFKIDAISGTQP